MRVTLPVTVLAALALAAATLALPQEQDTDRHSNEHSDQNFEGQKVRNLDSLGGTNLVRDVRDAHRFEYLNLPFARRYDLGPFVRQLQHRMPSYRDYADVPKRNFDEIDRTGFDNFFGKRSYSDYRQGNFDEIDRTSFDRFLKRARYEQTYDN